MRPLQAHVAPLGVERVLSGVETTAGADEDMVAETHLSAVEDNHIIGFQLGVGGGIIFFTE